LVRLRPGGPEPPLKINLDPELQIALLVQPCVVLQSAADRRAGVDVVPDLKMLEAIASRIEKVD